MARAGATIAAFALAALAAVGALFASVVVTAALSQSMSARVAGDALLWMAAVQLLGIAGVVGGFRWLAWRWSGAAPPWWSQGLLGFGLLCVAALLFVFAMVAMDR
jgi:hypothetical protein